MKKSFLDDKYRPTGESVLKESKISIVCGLIGMVLYCTLVGLSFWQGGSGGRYLGLIGWLLLVLTGAGEYYAVIGFEQPGGRVIAKVCGALLNGFVILVLILTFIRAFI